MLMLIMALNGHYFFAWAFFLLPWGGEFISFGKNKKIFFDKLNMNDIEINKIWEKSFNEIYPETQEKNDILKSNLFYNQLENFNSYLFPSTKNNLTNKILHLMVDSILREGFFSILIKDNNNKYLRNPNDTILNEKRNHYIKNFLMSSMSDIELNIYLKKTIFLMVALINTSYLVLRTLNIKNLEQIILYLKATSGINAYETIYKRANFTNPTGLNPMNVLEFISQEIVNYLENEFLNNYSQIVDSIKNNTINEEEMKEIMSYGPDKNSPWMISKPSETFIKKLYEI